MPSDAHTSVSLDKYTIILLSNDNEKILQNFEVRHACNVLLQFLKISLIMLITQHAEIYHQTICLNFENSKNKTIVLVKLITI